MAELRQRYAIGLSPLREALSRLVGEGLVIAEGQRGFRVAPFSPEDVDDLIFVWQTIVEGALRAAMARRDEHSEAAIVAAFHVLERRIGCATSEDPVARDSYEQAHRAFYLALTAGAASPRATYIQNALYDQARRYRVLLHRDQPDPKDRLEGYRTLMQLVLTSQTDMAVAKLREDLTIWRDGLTRRAGW